MPTKKEQKWFIEYLKCWNGSEAARRAGYKWPEKIGPRKLKKFEAEIKRHLRENAMEADEVLSRLADMARSDMSDFVNTEVPGGLPDLKAAQERGLTHLIKSISWTKQGVKLELYDAQAALVHIGRHLGLFTDRLEIKGDWRHEVREMLRSGVVTPEQVQDELGPDLAQELFNSIGLVVIGDGVSSGANEAANK